MQEAFAIGFANVIGGFFSTIPASSSLSRTALQNASGGRTQITSIISSLILMIILLALGPYFSVLPKASLAAIIAVNLRGMFRQFNSLPRIFMFSRIDFCVWVICFGSVISIGIEIGLICGVFALLISLVYRKSKSEISTIAQVGESELFRTAVFSNDETSFNIVKIPSSLDFITAQPIFQSLPTSGHLVLDCSATEYMDITGRECLLEFIKNEKLIISICTAGDDFYRQLLREGLPNGKNCQIFPSIIDAIHMMKDFENSKHKNSDESKEMENSRMEKEDQIIYTNTSFVFGEICNHVSVDIKIVVY